MNIPRTVIAVASALLLTACGTAETEPHDMTTQSSSTSASALPTSAEPVEEREDEGNPAGETQVEQSAEVPVAQPYIVDCQTGLGPVETYWSDGTVTGYSAHCQSVHDATVDEERIANTPVCDGTMCRYPSGAEFPDPNAVPTVDVPYTCNFDVLCDEAGNVIPGPGGPEVPVQLGNGQTCAGNGCTRPR